MPARSRSGPKALISVSTRPKRVLDPAAAAATVQPRSRQRPGSSSSGAGSRISSAGELADAVLEREERERGEPAISCAAVRDPRAVVMSGSTSARRSDIRRSPWAGSQRGPNPRAGSASLRGRRRSGPASSSRCRSGCRNRVAEPFAESVGAGRRGWPPGSPPGGFAEPPCACAPTRRPGRYGLDRIGITLVARSCRSRRRARRAIRLSAFSIQSTMDSSAVVAWLPHRGCAVRAARLMEQDVGSERLWLPHLKRATCALMPRRSERERRCRRLRRS